MMCSTAWFCSVAAEGQQGECYPGQAEPLGADRRAASSLVWWRRDELGDAAQGAALLPSACHAVQQQCGQQDRDPMWKGKTLEQ